MTKNHFDLVILGSGSTAFAAALRAQELGKTSVMTEQRTVGGTCVNRGCLPSKNLIEAAKLIHDAKNPRYPGLTPCEIVLDFKALIAQKTSSFMHTNFPSGYRVTFESGGSIDRSEIQGRLTKLCANVRDLTVTATIDSVEQTGPKSATATVTYSAQFSPFSYGSTGLIEKSKNQYVAVWKDQDTWTRYSDTDTNWHRESTTRLLRSPLWQHYEAQKPPTPPNTTSGSTPSDGLPSGE
jgi:hypothetical protein